MKSTRMALFGLLSILIPLLTAPSPVESQTSRKFVAYYTEWGVYDRKYVPADIPAAKLTHINYAFIKPSDTNADGLYECAIADAWAAKQKTMMRLVPGTNTAAGEDKGTLNQLRRLRTWRKDNGQTLPLLFSIGAYSMRDRFSAIASSSSHRQHFVNSCIQLMQQESFDGIDLDWEYPRSTETASHRALLQQFRDALTALGNNPRTGAPYLLTIAGPPDEYHLDPYDVAGIALIVDWVNVMAYNFHGCWGMDHTGHNAPLRSSSSDPDGVDFSTQGGVQMWIDRGMPAGKIVLGLAYYGKAFQALSGSGPNPSYPGRFATIDPAQNDSPNCAMGSWGSTTSGDLDYWDVVQRYVNLNGYTRYWDVEQEVPFLWKDAASYWITYDDPDSISTKVHWARNMGLGGVFAWELALESHPDAAPKVYPLTNAAAGCLNP
ncbi:MAG TPA: glycoside hydrolase family 18 protein [Thermoanaerobaculia bacterium]